MTTIPSSVSSNQPVLGNAEGDVGQVQPETSVHENNQPEVPQQVNQVVGIALVADTYSPDPKPAPPAKIRKKKVRKKKPKRKSKPDPVKATVRDLATTTKPAPKALATPKTAIRAKSTPPMSPDAVSTASPTTGQSYSVKTKVALGADGFKSVPSDSIVRLLATFPTRFKVSASIRFHRLRQTAWEQPVEALLATMPDYKLLVGNKEQTLGRVLQSLVISSTDPKQLSATTLVAHTRLGQKATQAFVGGPQPIAWSQVKQGMHGKRNTKGDPRELLIPFPRWAMLASPSMLKVTPVSAPPSKSAASVAAKESPSATREQPQDEPLSSPSPAPSSSPEESRLLRWMGRYRSAQEAAGKSGAAFSMVMKRLKTQATVPVIGTLATPQVATLVAYNSPKGFTVGGVLTFRNEAEAIKFESSLALVKGSAGITNVFAKRSHKLILSSLRTLSAARRGRRLAYRATIRADQMKTLLHEATRSLRTYFGRR